MTGKERTMSWKANLTLSAGTVTGSGVLLAAMTGVPTWATMLGAGAACLACAKYGSGALEDSPALDHLDQQGIEQAAKVFPLAPAAHAAWVAGALLVDAPGWWAATLVGLGFAEYGVARHIEYRAANRQRRNPPAAPAPPPAIVNSPHGELVVADPQGPINGMTQVLAAAGINHVRVVAWCPVGPPGEVLGVKFTAKLTAAALRKSSDNSRLSAASTEAIAIAVSEATGNEIGSSWVQIVKVPAAGTYEITITNSDTMTRVYPYAIDPRRVSIKDPALIGYGIDGLPHHERVCQHWLHTGGTRFGKTGLVQVIRTHVLRARDAVLWVGGTEKLYDSVGPWVDPYIGTGIRPPIDWIAKGAKDTLDMITAAFVLGRWRQSIPHHMRTGFKDVIVEIDEASFFLMIEKMLTDLDGESFTPSQMAAAIIKGVGSAGVWIHLVSQRGTNDQLGNEGGVINANIQVRTCFRTSDEEDVWRALGYKIQIPQHKGEFLVRGEDGEVVRLRAPYIQETDPNKPKVHDGANLNDVAMSLANTWTGLDEASAHALGDLYRNRPQTAEQLYRYLTGLDPDLEFGMPVTGSAVQGGDGGSLASTAAPQPGRDGAPYHPEDVTNFGPDEPGNGATVGAAHLPGSPVPVSPRPGTSAPNGPATTERGDPWRPPTAVPVGTNTGNGNHPFPATPVPAAPAVPSVVPEPREPAFPGAEPTREPQPAFPGTNGSAWPGTIGTGTAPQAAPTPMPSTAPIGGAHTAPDVEQDTMLRTLALIERLQSVNDDDGLDRLLTLGADPKVDIVKALDAFEAELDGRPVAGPIHHTAPVTTPSSAMPAGFPRPAMPTAREVVPSVSLAEAIAVIVAASRFDGMTRGEIINALSENTNLARSFKQQVSNRLTDLVQAGTLVRDAGRYWTPEFAGEHTTTGTETDDADTD